MAKQFAGLVLFISIALVSACEPQPQVTTPPKVSADACGSGGPIDNPDGNLYRPFQERTLVTASTAERNWLLRLPKDYQAGTPSDVVFTFHGATSNAQEQIGYSNFGALADRDGVIIVSPDANKVFEDPTHELAEYWDSAWEAKMRVRDYDVDFVLELVALLKSEYCTGDFYAAGMSAGGDMTTALACLVDSPFKTYASVTYRYYNADECQDAPARPHISFHGSEDQIVPLSGEGAPWFDPPVPDVMQSWAEHNGCDAPSIEERISDEVLHYGWANCDAATEWYLIEGGGHTWPGAVAIPPLGHTTEDISASELIWNFFFR